jgi:hypothetical protein
MSEAPGGEGGTTGSSTACWVALLTLDFRYETMVYFVFVMNLTGLSSLSLSLGLAAELSTGYLCTYHLYTVFCVTIDI